MYQPPNQQPPWQPQPHTDPPSQPQWQQPPTQYPPYQQQSQYYPPPPPYYQPPMPPPVMFVQPPPKRRNGCLIAVCVFIALVIFGIIVNAVSSTQSSTSGTTTSTTTSNMTQATDTPIPTDTPVPTTWTTIRSFTGNGQKKTSVFTVPDHWRLKWKCNPASDYFGQYNVIIDVYGSDGTYLDGAINTICQHGNTSGDTEEYQGGDVYLDLQIDGAYTVTVQTLQ